MLKIFTPAEVLPVRILYKSLYDRFVTFIVGVLQVLKPYYQPSRQSWAAHILFIQRSQFFLKYAPVIWLASMYNGCSLLLSDQGDYEIALLDLPACLCFLGRINHQLLRVICVVAGDYGIALSQFKAMI